MSDLTAKISKLPEIDKEDLKAIRAFLPGKVLGRTAALLSLLLLVLAFVAAVRIGIHQIPEFEQVLPPWAIWALLALCLLAVVAQIMFEWRVNRNRATLQQLAVKLGAVQTGYFRIGAYSDTAEDRKKFSRPDQADQKVLKWLTRATRSPLYLTGDSGSGKSSLLNASVFPALRNQGWTVIETRAYQDPLEALAAALSKCQGEDRLEEGADPDLRDLLKQATQLTPRLLVVLDQFEEFVILARPESRQAFAKFVTDLQLNPVRNFLLLLVLRSDYQSLLEDAGLPPLRSGENLFQLARFQLPTAEAFMRRSKLDLQPAALDRLLTSAAMLDDTPGLVRPITINVIGYVLASGKAVAASLDAGTLVRQYIEQTLQQQAIRDYAPRLVEKMITEEGTKQPRSEKSLAKDASLQFAEVRAVLNCLSDAGLARPLDPTSGVWELSHDFIARAIARFLGRQRTRFLRSIGAYVAPALLVLAFSGGLGAAVWNHFRIDSIRAQLNDLGITTRSNEIGKFAATARDLHDNGLSEGALLLAELGDRLYSLDLSSAKIADIGALKKLTALQQIDLTGTQVNNIDALRALTALQDLSLSGTKITNIDALRAMTALQRLDLTGTQVASIDALKGLTALQDLNLRRTQVTRIDALNGLTALRILNLSGTSVTNIDALRALTALQHLNLLGTNVTNIDSMNGLTGLQQLDLTGVQVTNIDALKEKTALQNLNLSRTKITSINALNGLASLQQLNLMETNVIDIDALNGLTALQILNLSGTQVANIDALRSLTALQILNLSGTQITDIDALRSLTALQQLDLTGRQFTNIDALRPLTSLQMLNLSGAQVTNVDALSPLTSLQILDLSGTQVTNIDALSPLTSLQMLNLSGTQVTSIDALRPLTALQLLNLPGTKVTNIGALRALTALQILNLSGTQVANIDALRALTALQQLDLTGTPVTNIDALKGSTALRLLLLGTKVTNVDALKGLTARVIHQ